MSEWIKRWGIPGVAIFVLVAAVILQVLASTKPVPEGSLKTSLKEAIPGQINGWQVKDLDLGPTESVTQRSYDLLRLDDFVHRQYSRGDKSFSVYIAYWKPGKMPVRLVNQHTPDRCWTEVGWTCAEREWNVHRSAEGRDLKPAQWGVYELGEAKNYTYFWHIVGGDVHWYGGNRVNTRASLSTVWEDFRKFGLNVHREQFFIRVVSPHPMDDLWQEPAFESVMADLADLCLAEATPAEPVALK
ncbi:MAG TPA: exosortase-associated EpsI family protein [Oceanipulchritudo sp.]|nr:exosortase-associated EpsI family protein [Oceanipulchritudo sp.]